MEKIIVRNKILQRGHVNSAYISLCNNKSYYSVESFLKDYTYNEILNRLYEEQINHANLEQSNLYLSYILTIETQLDNEYFKILYKLDDEFAVHLTGSIYLYHLIPKKEEIYSSLVPWFYADSKNYFGDTWWEKDSEIINSLETLSIIEFLKRYKGY